MKFRITFDRYEHGHNKFVEVEAQSMWDLMGMLCQCKIPEVCDEEATGSEIIEVKACGARFLDICIDDDDFEDAFDAE